MNLINPMRVLAPLLSLVALGALAGPVAAQTILIEAPTTNPIADTALRAFDFDVTLQLPAGYYTGMKVVMVLPTNSKLVRLGTASPTSGEFDNAVYNATANTLTWNQLLPLDLTAGAGVRKFRLNAHFDRYFTRVNTPFAFAVTGRGDVGTDELDLPAPFTDAVGEHTVTATGAGATLEFYYVNNTSIVRYGVINRGYGMSAEATPRPGQFRRYVFAVGNRSQAPIDAGTSWSIDLGDNLYFVAAGGATNPQNFAEDLNFTFGGLPIPFTKATGPISATFDLAASDANIGTVWVDAFVPCDDLAKTSADAATLAPTYVTRGSSAATATDFLGNVASLSVQGGDIAGPDLTLVCGSGGSLNKSEAFIGESGTRFGWQITLSPGVGVTSISDAMIVDELPAETIAIDHYSHSSFTYNTESFTYYYCDFDGVFTGQFGVAQFLAQRDARCRTTGFVVGDTHMVMFAPEFAANAGESLGSVASFFWTTVSMAWSEANIGARLSNRAYFNGTTIYGARGDTILEVTNEDPWEDLQASDLVPDLSSMLNVGTWTITSPVDANGGSGTAIFTLDNLITGRWPINPHIEIDVPAGVTITQVLLPQLFSANCESPLLPGTIPTGPFTSGTIAFTIGSAAEPWRWAPDACSTYMHVAFTVDPSYPFIDRQAIPFVVRATADAPTGVATKTYNSTVLVTTGMDVQLASECWEAAVDPLVPAPPAAGLGLFRAVAVNRGSDDLDDIELRYTVPANATYVTAFPGEDFPAGVSLQVSRNGGSTWSALPAGTDSAVTDVRIQGFSIEGLGVNALRPSFYVGVLPTGDGSVIGSAWMETQTNQLGRTPTKETGFVACTGTVVVEKFFDANGSGARERDEPTLGAGFGFAVDLGGGALLTGTTDGEGRATIAGVPEGTWPILETATPTIQGTWQPTTTVSVTVVEGAVATVAFGNDCECASNNKCQTGTCDATGACTFANVSDGTICGNLGDLCNGEMVCQAGQCITEPPINCDDRDMCTTDTCSNGNCETTEKSCKGGLAYYTPVTSADGKVVGAFVCFVEDGKVRCNLKGETLEVVKEYGTLCGQ